MKKSLFLFLAFSFFAFADSRVSSVSVDCPYSTILDPVPIAATYIFDGSLNCTSTASLVSIFQNGSFQINYPYKCADGRYFFTVSTPFAGEYTMSAFIGEENAAYSAACSLQKISADKPPSQIPETSIFLVPAAAIAAMLLATRRKRQASG